MYGKLAAKAAIYGDSQEWLSYNPGKDTAISLLLAGCNVRKA
jgi:hypothetical protein